MKMAKQPGASHLTAEISLLRDLPSHEHIVSMVAVLADEDGPGSSRVLLDLH